MHRLGARWEECAVGNPTRNQRVVEGGEATLGELIHREVRRASEQAVEEDSSIRTR